MALASCALTAHAQSQDVRLQILSGKTGRPATNAHVLLYRDGNRTALDGSKTATAIITDGEGYAQVPNTDADSLMVYVDGRQPCSKTFKRTFMLADIRSRGVVSENSCRAHIHMYPQAGTLIVFVRDLTFMERMKH